MSDSPSTAGRAYLSTARPLKKAVFEMTFGNEDRWAGIVGPARQDYVAPAGQTKADCPPSGGACPDRVRHCLDERTIVGKLIFHQKPRQQMRHRRHARDRKNQAGWQDRGQGAEKGREITPTSRELRGRTTIRPQQKPSCQGSDWQGFGAGDDPQQVLRSAEPQL
ncbi:hypothetical protein QA649_04905 [Bradyrhizobium sp. CB1717]|uniref:hypothetical protein n=1 Tax=Bradyrhizobium sp. CB1717 TaxID=3039154 RepID=UPI0024B256D7|nr:hypothetical protein [Bradyrhizobium sp. CB1717]WFU25557.1 hypothetical protein QA649_04905 [Bradyrhizobium sp. CB1717]